MKRLASLILAAAIFATPALHAQNSGNGSTNGTNRALSWGVGLTGGSLLLATAIIVSLHAGKKQGSFNH